MVVASGASYQDGRRTDTRQRIHEVALTVFSERGWDGATLREIAERLRITRPALYYHYKSKEDILTSIHRELACSVDDILTWAREQPPIMQTRTEILMRLSALMAGPWGTFIRFAQANEAAVRDLAAAEEFDDRMDALAELLRPTNTIAGRIEARLALGALFMADARKRQLGGSDKARTKAALATALRLVADPAGRDHTTETQ